MVKLYSVSLFLSWKCNFACAHCGFSCGPDREEKMSLEDAAGYIDAAAENPDLQMIAFSGGEPFLYFDEVKTLMAHSYSKGLQGGITTNGYWASGYKETLAVLTGLQEIGLKNIITSFDDYHNRFVPAENISNIIRAASELGIHCGLNILMTKRSRINGVNAGALLGVDLDRLVDEEKLRLTVSSPILVGNAVESCAPEDRVTYYADKLLGHPCPFILGCPIITPTGALYACCGFADASSHGPASIAYVGELKEHGFSRLFDNLSHNLMYNIIYEYGPYILVRMALEANPELVANNGHVANPSITANPGFTVRTEFVSDCDVCGEISTNPALRKAVGEVLMQLGRQRGDDAMLRGGDAMLRSDNRM